MYASNRIPIALCVLTHTFPIQLSAPPLCTDRRVTLTHHIHALTIERCHTVLFSVSLSSFLSFIVGKSMIQLHIQLLDCTRQTHKSHVRTRHILKCPVSARACRDRNGNSSRLCGTSTSSPQHTQKKNEGGSERMKNKPLVQQRHDPHTRCCCCCCCRAHNVIASIRLDRIHSHTWHSHRMPPTHLADTLRIAIILM